MLWFFFLLKNLPRFVEELELGRFGSRAQEDVLRPLRQTEAGREHRLEEGLVATTAGLPHPHRGQLV